MQREFSSRHLSSFLLLRNQAEQRILGALKSIERLTEEREQDDGGINKKNRELDRDWKLLKLTWVLVRLNFVFCYIKSRIVDKKTTTIS
ncbi:unnamed protein product [Allacma fusca]|uniref:Uncharacterized protein n=1 Tax=Allacma fusca TaxID=39272 RepID=A0A8J2JFG7_9HEXA|nr:unnamed protein product [Allacma fusca]